GPDGVHYNHDRNIVKGLQQAQFAQFAPHLLGHFGRAGGRARQVARGLLGLKIAPPLEGRARARLDQHQFAVEHNLTAPDAVLAGGRPDVENTLAAGDLAADHPIKRAAVAEFIRAFRYHAGSMDVLGLLSAFFLFLELLLDPFFEIRDRVAADAELDEMKGHRGLSNHGTKPMNSILLLIAPDCRASS